MSFTQREGCMTHPPRLAAGMGSHKPPGEERRATSSKQKSLSRDLSGSISATVWPNPCHQTGLLSPREQGSGRGH